jgi:3-hydroxyisobutyrate dehydrogenase-like beta-hydroxyacid dehydrogenase
VEIGFIGLGHMGFPMARRLIEANNRVVAFDTRAEALDRVVALGAQAASSPKEVADLVETVMTSLPSPQAARMILSLEKNNAYNAYRQLWPLPGAMVNRNAYRKPVD